MATQMHMQSADSHTPSRGCVRNPAASRPLLGIHGVWLACVLTDDIMEGDLLAIAAPAFADGGNK
jgi:hypothetical protein